jgi:gamma-glutamyltranspeptidase/glutathione hydrolase
MDSKGEAVSMTITLNGNYGSGVVSDKFGIALNNEMDDFTTEPNKANKYGLMQGESNLVKAGKRPLSSMSPTIVTDKDNKAVLAIGAPGGPRIISGVFQALYRVMYNNLDIEQAIMAPRVHHQFSPDILRLEENKFSPNVIKLLQKKGQNIKFISNVAKVCGVRKNKDGLLEAYSDYRGEAGVSGY